jgi:hypothetical protein
MNNKLWMNSDPSRLRINFVLFKKKNCHPTLEHITIQQWLAGDQSAKSQLYQVLEGVLHQEMMVVVVALLEGVLDQPWWG